MPGQKVFIGADYGGTKLLLGAVTAQGEVLSQRSYPTGTRNHAEAVRIVRDGVCDFLRTVSFHPEAIGMGLVGEIDHSRGIWSKYYALADDSPAAICRQIEEQTKVRCFIDNDVKAASFAEKFFGEGRQTGNFVYLNIGTGISAAQYVDGHLLRGRYNNAGEIGQFPCRQAIDASERNIEEIASGGGMRRRFVRMAEVKGDKSALERFKQAKNGSILYELTDEGNPIAVKVTGDAVQAICDLLLNIIASCAPDTIVLAGGAVKDGWMFKRIMANMYYGDYGKGTVIRLTELDRETVGLKGAAMMAMASLRENE